MTPNAPRLQPTLFQFVAVGAALALVSSLALVLLGNTLGIAVLGGVLIFAALQLVYLALLVRAAHAGTKKAVPPVSQRRPETVEKSSTRRSRS